MKDLTEEAVLERRRDLFTAVDLVFFDTTSLDFEGRDGQTLSRYGHGKDHRQDLKCDATIRGHVFCSFLALLLKAELEKRLTARGGDWEWAEVLRGLDNLQEVAAVFRGRRYLLRSQLPGHAHMAVRAVGVAVPPTIRAL